MRELLWRAVARIVTMRAVTNWLIERAARTPYTPIRKRNGSAVYMDRLWLFNPYPNEGDSQGWEQWDRSWRRHLPSMRVHHIRLADDDDHPHDHPWNARTIVLRNGYAEERYEEWWRDPLNRQRFLEKHPGAHPLLVEEFTRRRGYTGRLLFGEFHRISWVPPDGVWTLFITWRRRGTWGFDVDGQKVPWRKYLGLERAVEHHPV